MKKIMFRLLIFFMIAFTGSFFSHSTAAMLDGGSVFLVIGKTGNVNTTFNIPDQYLQMDDTLTEPLKISIFNNKNQVIHTLTTKETVLSLESVALEKGSYAIVFELGEINYKTKISL